MSILDPKPPTRAELSATILDEIETAAPSYALRDGAKDIPWPSGLVAFWDFTESAAPYRSKTGAGKYDLIDSGGTPVGKHVSITGPFGSAVSFAPGKHLKVPVEEVGALNIGRYSKQFTVIAWARRVDNQGSCFAGIWKEDGGVAARQYALWADLYGFGGDHKVVGHASKTGLASPKQSDGTLLPYSRDLSASRRQWKDGDMRFIGATYDGSQIVSYLDGLADSYTAYTEPGPTLGEGLTYDKNPYKGPDSTGWVEGLNATPSEFTVGVAVAATGTGQLTGEIGGLAVFNRALTQAEIMRIHLAALDSASLPAIKNDMARERDPRFGVKLPIDTVAMKTARGSTADTTLPADQMFYSAQASGGKPYIAYNNEIASNQTVPAIAYADYVGGLDVTQVRKINALLLNHTTVTKVRFVVRVGSAWFATAAQYACAAAHTNDADWTGAELAEFTMTRAAAAWRDLTVTPNTALTLGAVRTAKLPAGDITGYGVLADEGVGSLGKLRVSDLSIWV